MGTSGKDAAPGESVGGEGRLGGDAGAGCRFGRAGLCAGVCAGLCVGVGEVAGVGVCVGVGEDAGVAVCAGVGAAAEVDGDADFDGDGGAGAAELGELEASGRALVPDEAGVGAEDEELGDDS